MHKGSHALKEFEGIISYDGCEVGFIFELVLHPRRTILGKDQRVCLGLIRSECALALRVFPELGLIRHVQNDLFGRLLGIGFRITHLTLWLLDRDWGFLPNRPSNLVPVGEGTLNVGDDHILDLCERCGLLVVLVCSV